MVAMTGTTAAGRRVPELAAGTLKKVHLELGGNDAIIVCADADLDEAAEAMVLGRFTSGNGQICCAVKRVLVHRMLYPALLEAVVERTAGLVSAIRWTPRPTSAAYQPPRRRAGGGAGGRPSPMAQPWLQGAGAMVTSSSRRS